MKKFIQSRKFWIMIIVFMLIWSGFWFTIQSKLVTENSIVLLFGLAVSCTTLFGVASIGGYIWKDWIKSTHYKEELNGL